MTTVTAFPVVVLLDSGRVGQMLLQTRGSALSMVSASSIRARYASITIWAGVEPQSKLVDAALPTRFPFGFAPYEADQHLSAASAPVCHSPPRIFPMSAGLIPWDLSSWERFTFRCSAVISRRPVGRPLTAGPFVQLFALELGEGRHHGQHRRTHWAGRGDPLGGLPKRDPTGFQVIDGCQEIAVLVPQTVQLPHHHLVLARTQMVKHPVQLSAAGPGPADPILDENHFAPCLIKGVHLQLGILVHRANPCISDTGQFRLRCLVKGLLLYFLRKFT